MLSYSSLSQAQKIYVRTDGDTFQYTENTLKKIDISAERKESNISLMRKELTPNEFRSLPVPYFKIPKKDYSKRT